MSAHHKQNEASFLVFIRLVVGVPAGGIIDTF